jgi:heme/copper-type cytochrome/quinol oxidase subunit 3
MNMGRLVRKPQVADLDSQIAGLEGAVHAGFAGTHATITDPGDGYLERMVKYVPAEIIAFSMLINAILEQAMKSGGENAAMAGVPVPVIATGALLVACALTPLFCWYVRRDGDAWVTNAIVSTIALPFWAYLMGAVAFANHHDGNLAAILLMSFTVVSGLVAPRPERPKLREQQVVEEDLLVEEIAVERPRLVDVLAG